jgi:hypothetical protein
VDLYVLWAQDERPVDLHMAQPNVGLGTGAWAAGSVVGLLTF